MRMEFHGFSLLVPSLSLKWGEPVFTMTVGKAVIVSGHHELERSIDLPEETLCMQDPHKGEFPSQPGDLVLSQGWEQELRAATFSYRFNVGVSGVELSFRESMDAKPRGLMEPPLSCMIHMWVHFHEPLLSLSCTPWIEATVDMGKLCIQVDQRAAECAVCLVQALVNLGLEQLIPQTSLSNLPGGMLPSALQIHEVMTPRVRDKMKKGMGALPFIPPCLIRFVLEQVRVEMADYQEGRGEEVFASLRLNDMRVVLEHRFQDNVMMDTLIKASVAKLDIFDSLTKEEEGSDTRLLTLRTKLCWATTPQEMMTHPIGITRIDVGGSFEGLRLTLSFAILTRIAFFITSGILRGVKMAAQLEHLQSTITRSLKSSFRETLDRQAEEGLSPRARNNTLQGFDQEVDLILQGKHRIPGRIDLNVKDVLISIVAKQVGDEVGTTSPGGSHRDSGSRSGHFNTMDLQAGCRVLVRMDESGGEDEAEVAVNLGACCRSATSDTIEHIVEPFGITLQFVRAQDCGPERWTLLNSCMAELGVLRMSLPQHVICFVEEALTLHHTRLLSDQTINLLRDAFPTQLTAICGAFNLGIAADASKPISMLARDRAESTIAGRGLHDRKAAMIDDFDCTLQTIEESLQRGLQANVRSTENVGREREELTEMLADVEDKLEESLIELHYSKNGITPNIYNHKVIVAQAPAAAIKNQGFLKMEAGTNLRTMKRRWFVLRGSELLFLRDTSSTVPLGHIQLEGALVSDCQPVVGTNENHALCFQLIWSDVTILLQAPSLEEKGCWISELMKVIAEQQAGFCGFPVEERSQKRCYFELGVRTLVTYSEPNGVAQGTLELSDSMSITSGTDHSFKIRDDSRFCLSLIAEDGEQKQRWMEALMLSITGPLASAPETRLRGGSILRSKSNRLDTRQLQIRVIGHQTINEDFTLYTIEVSHGSISWPVYRRFSEFVQLHRQLTKEHHSSITSLPPAAVAAFKTRTLFGSLHADLVTQRRSLLQAYVASIVGDAALRNSPCFYTFFELQSLVELDPSCDSMPSQHLHGTAAACRSRVLTGDVLQEV